MSFFSSSRVNTKINIVFDEILNWLKTLKKLENLLFEKYAYSKFSNILWKEGKEINEKFSVQGMRAREIISTILTKTDFAAGDIKSQKEAKDMVNDLVNILNTFYEKYNIDKKIIL